jgi:hypothetical protein
LPAKLRVFFGGQTARAGQPVLANKMTVENPEPQKLH